jgi:PKD repeat protein
MIISNSYGCKDSMTQVITIYPLPNARFTINYVGNKTFLHAADSSLNDTSYHWTLGDGNTASGHLATHLYPKNKSYPVKLNMTGKTGCVNTFDSTVNITVSGIEPFENDDISLRVYPNPFHENTSIEYQLHKNSSVSILLYDISGKEAGRITQENQQQGNYRYEINADKYKLTPGVYLLKIMINDQNVSSHIVKF